jgi:vacuolar-type H+-ATPase subunit H
MEILDNRLLGIILGILLIIVIFFVRNKKYESFGLWDGLMNTAFKLVEKPIDLVMSKLGNIAGSEVNKVTTAVKQQATNAIGTATNMARDAISNAKQMATTAISQTKSAVNEVSDKVQSTVKRIASDSMNSIQRTIQQVVTRIQTFVMKLMATIQKFFTKTIVSTLQQSRERAKEVWNYVVNTTYGKIKNFTNRIRVYVMRFINYYIKMAKPYSLYIAIAAGILGVGGLGSYIYFNFFHNPNAKSSNNNNTPVNNTPVNNTPVDNTPVDIDIPQTIPQTVV